MKLSFIGTIDGQVTVKVKILNKIKKEQSVKLEREKTFSKESPRL